MSWQHWNPKVSRGNLKVLRENAIYIYIYIYKMFVFLPPPRIFSTQPDFFSPPCSVANLATLSLDLATFQTPLAPSDKSSDFWKNLSNFPNVASTVLRARDIELHLSLSALISERWLRLRGEAHSSDRTAADIDVNELRMCTRCCHGPITCLLLLCLT